MTDAAVAARATADLPRRLAAKPSVPFAVAAYITAAYWCTAR